MKMLFVEDDELIRNNYVEYLKIYFKEVFEASSSEEGLEIFNQEKIDFILSDIEMENINGIEMIKHIRQRDDKIPIVILSAYDSKEYLKQSIKLNLTEYLVKPIKYEHFRKIIEDIVSLLKKEHSKEENLYDDYIWSHKENKLLKNNKEIKLTKTEIEFFNCFCKKERYFSLEEVYDILFPIENFNENKIRMIIKRIRSKTNTQIIINNFNQYYTFNFK